MNALSLLDLRRANPDRFHPQVWYDREPFASVTAALGTVPMPRSRLIGIVPTADAAGLPRAALLARLFLERPGDPLWRGYLWCADKDRKGQRVFVGGVCSENGGRLEVHRHLRITNLWSTPVWV